MGIPAHRAAVAIYEGDLLKDVLDDEIASARPSKGLMSGEFFYFSDPKNKLKALKGIMFQPPLPIEVEFNSLQGIPQKIKFIKSMINGLTRDNFDLVLDFAYDLNSEISQKHSLTTKDNSDILSSTARSLREQILRRGMELETTAEMKHQIQMIKEKGNLIQGTSKQFILEWISRELKGKNPTRIYRNELVEVKNEVSRL